MPSGRTHDIFTCALIPSSLIAAQWYWGDLRLSVIATAAMAFAGLMFGPDLDLHSTQYRRWGPVRFIWYPYRLALKHRSRLSHGLLFSTVFRVAYFFVVILLVSTLALYVRRRYVYGAPTSFTAEFQQVADDLTGFWRRTDKQYFTAGFLGLWAGAAAHSIVDVVSSIMRLIWKVF